MHWRGVECRQGDQIGACCSSLGEMGRGLAERGNEVYQLRYELLRVPLLLSTYVNLMKLLNNSISKFPHV